MYFDHNYLLFKYSASSCIYMYMIVFLSSCLNDDYKLASPTTNDNRWLMADVWTSSCHMDTNGANLTCWLCLINCRFDNSNIIWHYTREKKLLCSQLLSVKKGHWWGFVPEIIFVVFDVTSSPHPSNLLLLSIFLAVYQWLHSIIIQTIRLTTKYNNI